jgi:hypoxanthine phosphoribosyltransferase
MAITPPESIQLLDKSFDLMISRQEIEDKVQELSLKIGEDYKDKDPLFVVVLSGAFFFASSLLLKIPYSARVQFIKLSSYSHIESNGRIEEDYFPEKTFPGEHVVIIEDIVDSGTTLHYLNHRLNECGVASVATCCLFKKTLPDHQYPRIDYFGFEIGPEFIVGFGLDYESHGRNLPDIYCYKA